MPPDPSPLPPRVRCGVLHCTDCHASLPFLVTCRDLCTALRLSLPPDVPEPLPEPLRQAAERRLLQSLRQMLAQSANRHVGCPRRRMPSASTTPGYLFVSGPN